MDIKTLLYILFLINLFLGVFTFFIKFSLPALKNIELWATANLLIAAGYLLILLRTQIPVSFSITAANALLFLAVFLRLYALKKILNINNSKSEIYFSISILTLYCILFIYFTIIINSILVRNYLIATFHASIAVYSSILVFRNTKQKNRLIYHTIALSFLLFALLMALRIYDRHSDTVIRDFLYSDLFNIVQFQASIIIDVALTILFLFISIQKSFEEQAEIDAKFKYIAENVSDGILTFDSKYRLNYISPSYLKQLGYAEAEKNTKKLYLNIHNSDRTRILKQISEAINAKKTQLFYTFRAQKANSEYYWREDHAQLAYNSKGDYTGAVVICRDISKRIETEEQLKKLSVAIEQSPTTIVITNLKGIIEYVNPQFTKLTGYTANEAIGQNPRILKSGKTDLTIHKQLWKTIASGKVWQGEFINKKKNGDEFIEQARIAPVFDLNQKLISYIAIKEDITEKKKLENEILKQNTELAQHIATKDKFFNIIAHDLKNPFSALNGLSGILLKNHDLYDSQRREKLINAIHQVSVNTYTLLENLLAWAGAQTGNLTMVYEKIQLKALANQVISYLTETALSKKIVLQNLITENIYLYADRNMIETVLRNLISNAIKYTPENGTVLLNVNRTNDSTEISVTDTGVGMNNYTKNSLFKTGETISTSGTQGEKGTGLGLLLCKEFIDIHKGKIWVESETGKGSIFKFSIPNKLFENYLIET